MTPDYSAPATAWPPHISFLIALFTIHMFLPATVVSLAGVAVASGGLTTPRPEVPTSWRLLARVREGDAGALTALLARYLPGLRRWARGRLPVWARSASDTSDLLHDAILHTLAHLDLFQPRGRRALAAYLRTAVRNRIADEHRRAARWQMVEATSALPAHDALPLDRVLARDTERRYRAALARLSTRDRTLVVAHLELEYTHAQLGCMIGRSPNAARMALCRAFARLAEQMRD
jgi:RNA polymerase sigma factor (sigma-70 family)